MQTGRQIDQYNAMHLLFVCHKQQANQLLSLGNYNPPVISYGR